MVCHTGWVNSRRLWRRGDLASSTSALSSSLFLLSPFLLGFAHKGLVTSELTDDPVLRHTCSETLQQTLEGLAFAQCYSHLPIHPHSFIVFVLAEFFG
jgi:hypothetical protein